MSQNANLKIILSKLTCSDASLSLSKYIEHEFVSSSELDIPYNLLSQETFSEDKRILKNIEIYSRL